MTRPLKQETCPVLRWFGESSAVSRSAVAVLVALCSVNPARAAEYVCKDVGPDWAWLGDHVAAWVEYVIIGSPGRHYDVGTGVFFHGRPWGTMNTYEGKVELTAYGAGALHAKQADQGLPFKVCATSSKIGAITILKVEF
jgi:hypothetical protein